MRVQQKQNIESEALLDLASEAGQMMLESGGETYRAESIVCALLRSFGAKEAETFATPTGFMASFEGSDRKTHAFVRRIQKRQMNLDRITRLNSLANKATEGKLKFLDAKDELRSIETNCDRPLKYKLLGAAMIASFFCLLFGGSIKDALVALVTGTLLILVMRILSKRQVSDFFINISGGAFCALFILLCTELKLCDSLSLTFIGTIMLMVPGVAIVNAIRDTIAGDLVAGIARGADAFISAAGISIGSGVIFKAFALLGGSIL